MKTNEEWLFRPVMADMCKYEDIVFSKFDLAQIAEMNELLDIKQENDRRRNAAIEAKRAAEQQNG